MLEHPKYKGSILLVDHDEDWLKSAQEALAARGYKADAVVSAQDALEVVDDKYDVILMNWILAEQERVLLEQLARPRSENPRVVVVMFPLQQLPGRMRLVFKAGAYDCVDKPSDRQELLELVDVLKTEHVFENTDSKNQI
jgi:DNA-binding response OmpR family regulator